MNVLKRLPTLIILCLAIGGLVYAWPKLQATHQMEKASNAKSSSAPAKVAKTVNESDLNIVELSPEAIPRLGLTLQPVEIRSMPRSRSYGAEMVLPTGAAVIVSSPLSGTLRHPQNGRFPQVGQRIEAGQTVLELLPLLTPERAVLTPAERIQFAQAKAAIAQTQIDADGQFQQATVQVEAAQIALARAERLLQDNAGTRRAVDDAKALLDLAERTLAAAKERKKLVDNITLDEEAGTLKPLGVESPLEGIVRTTHVQVGQLVAAGLPLFEVMNDAELWIKVPVYVGELDEIDGNQSIRLTLLDGRQSAEDVIGTPVALPPTALPLSAAVDLYYEIPNSDHRFRPGQRVAAQIPLKGKDEVQAVPWSAVLHDIYGGQWVYERVGERQFARHRVEVGWIDQGWAALLRGPVSGTQVVTAGVPELAGTEFGFAK